MAQLTLDLPGMYLAAQQLKMRRQAEERQRQLDEQIQARQASQDAQAQRYRADTLSQAEAATLQRRDEFAQRQQKARADAAAKAQAEQAKANANRQRMAAYRLASDPSARIEDIVAPLAAAKALPQGFDEAMAQYGAANDRAGLARVLEDAAVGQLGMPNSEKQAQERTTNDILNYQLMQKDPKFAKFLEDQRRNGGGGVTVNLGGNQGAVGLTTPNQTAQQEKVLTARDQLRQLGNIKRAVTDAGGWDTFASYSEGMLSGARNRLSRAGVGVDRDQLAKRATAIAEIGQFVSPVINRLSGANVPPSEYERIVRSLPDPDRDSGPVLEAKIAAWERNLAYEADNGLDALLNGIRSGQIALPGESLPATAATQGAAAPGTTGTVPDLSQMSPEDIQRWVAEGK